MSPKTGHRHGEASRLHSVQGQHRARRPSVGQPTSHEKAEAGSVPSSVSVASAENWTTWPALKSVPVVGVVMVTTGGSLGIKNACTSAGLNGRL